MDTRKSGRTRGIDDLWDDVEAHHPGLVKVELEYRRGKRPGRPRKWTSDYIVPSPRPDVSAIVWDIQEVAEEIEARHGVACTFFTTCVVDTGDGIKRAPKLTWDLDDGERTDAEIEALSVVRHLQRVIRTQGTALSRQIGDVERASGAAVKVLDALTRMDGNNVELARARYEHERWQAGQTAETERANEELGLIKDLAPKGLAVMAAREAREAATAAKGGEKSALWKQSIEIARAIRGRAQVQDVLGEKGTELLDALGDARTKAEVGEAFDGLRRLADLPPDDPDFVNPWNLIGCAPEIVPLLDMIVTG